MLLICAWCRVVMGEKEPFEDASSTHGICPPCKRKVQDELRERQRRRENEQARGRSGSDSVSVYVRRRNRSDLDP